MARPQKQTVDYFPHYANASEKKTLFILETKFGVAAYAFWFKLLEILASSPGHYFNFNNPAAWEFLLAKTKVSDDIGRRILNELALLDAINEELYREGYVWSQNLVDGLTEVYRRRQVDLPQKPSLNSPKPPYSEVIDDHSEVIDDINPSPPVVSTDRNTQREVVEEVEEGKGGEEANNGLPDGDKDGHWLSKYKEEHSKR